MQISNALTQAHPTDIHTVDHHFVIDGGNAGQTPHLHLLYMHPSHTEFCFI